MFDKKNFIDDVMEEWSYRICDGIIDMTNYNHRQTLKTILKEHDVPNEAIQLIFLNLTSGKQLMHEVNLSESITSTGLIYRGKTHVTGSAHQDYIDPYQVQNMLPVQDNEEDEEALKDDGQTVESTLMESYMFDQDQMAIVKTGNLIPIDDVLTENKFKCFMTGEIYCETKNGTLVKENDLIVESGILDPTKIGQTLTDKKNTYTLISNDYVKNISNKIKSLKNIDVYGKETDNGYLIKMEDEKGKEKYIVKYTDKELASKVPPKQFGLKWVASSENLSIKPQNVLKSLLDTEATAQQIVSVVKNSVNEIDEPLGLKEYLTDLLDFSYRGKKMKKMEEYGEISKNSLAQVEKNYGEILGALWVASKESGKIMFPGKGNYPLIDFLFVKADETIKYSSKGGSSAVTNTIAPKDILNYINAKKEYDVFKSGEYKDVYDLLTIINDNTILDMPKRLADFFKIKYDENEIDADPEKWMILTRDLVKKLNEDKYLKLVNEMVNSILTVDYIITVLMKNPIKPDFIIKSGKEVNVAFRDKNSARHRRDKIGLQIK